MVRKKGAKRGQGTVYTCADGRHVAETTIDGKRRQFYGKTEGEALEKMQKAIYEQKQGLLVKGSKQTLGDYLNQWLEDVHKPTVRLSSYQKYRGILDNHIIPALGHILLQKLTPDKIQALYAQKLREHFSPATIRIVHAVLRKALDNAVLWGRIPRNICDLVSLPRIPRHEIQPLTQAQAQRLMEAARGDRLEAMLTIALLTGMRKGEIQALRWQDINFETGGLAIQRSVS